MSAPSFEIERRDLRLSEPYTIAYETYDRVSLLFVRVASAGTVGHGSASPAPEITGETVADCAAALEEAAGRLSRAGWPADRDTLGWIARLAERTPAAAAALDMALWDLRGRAAGVPVHELLGGRRAALDTSITLGIDTPEETVRRAGERVAQGFRALKVKGGLDAEDDAERLLQVRAAVGDGVELRFDANQGFDLDGAVRFVRRAADAFPSVLEQPLPANDLGGAVELARELAARRAGGRPTPLLLGDESCVGVADAATLTVRGAAEALNLKLMKIGGLGPASAAAALASARGMPCMVSCMDESALSIAAALHWALASPGVRWVDLDGHLDLLEDPFAGLVELHDGRLSPAPGPGLGDPRPLPGDERLR